jgi:hypothetical protein
MRMIAVLALCLTPSLAFAAGTPPSADTKARLKRHSFHCHGESVAGHCVLSVHEATRAIDA